MTLRLTRRARRDIQEIGAYIRSHDPGAALRVRDVIRTALQTLVTFPEGGHRLGDGLWRLALPCYPYIVFYRIDRGDVLVVTIRHAARRPLIESS